MDQINSDGLHLMPWLLLTRRTLVLVKFSASTVVYVKTFNSNSYLKLYGRKKYTAAF